MKFKITCRPRIRNSVAQKFISSSLAIGLLLNNTSASLASVLSEDGRYETFEGSNIAIPDILEEDRVDVEIEGNTLINLIDYNKIDINYYNYNSGYISPKKHDDRLWENIEELCSLKPNTYYTVIVENLDTVDDVHIGYDKYFKIAINNKITTFRTPDVVNYGFTFKVFGAQSKARIMLLEGDWTNKEIPQYFKGIKSVGQDDENGHKIEIISNNKNLYKPHLYHEGLHGLNFNLINGKLYVSGTANDIFDYRPVTATSNSDLFELLNKLPVGTDISISNNLGLSSYFSLIRDEKQIYVREKITIEKDDYNISCFVRFEPNGETYNNQELLIQIELNNIPSEFMEYQSNKIEIPLSEPLRSLPNGVKDRIIKRNGQWVIERKVEEVIIDSLKGLGQASEVLTDNNITTSRVHIPYREAETLFPNIKRITGVTDIMCDKLPSKQVVSNMQQEIQMAIGKTDAGVSLRLEGSTEEECERWLNNNPLTIAYELDTPIYESLKIESKLNIYTDVTHIFNISTIPAIMKITIDRTLNRAVEYTELAKTNPTVANISNARYWSNLLKESIKKGQLQDEINSITDIEDFQLERKSASSNLDVYVKSQNMLSVSLNTNSITFDGYSGTEDMEMLGAVNISINSSLPYSLNAYMPTEISNSDKSETLPIDILNIRNSGETVYQTFDNTTDKVVLKDSCNAGNNKMHDIDLKLASNLAHKADVYKTVIKFEAEQK